MVTAAQEVERPVVDGLQAVLDHEPGPLGQLGQEVQDLIAHAIRPGADGQADHLGMGEGVVIGPSKPVDRPVGVGAGLEIGDEPVGPVAAIQPADRVVDLSGDWAETIPFSHPPAGAEAFRIAEDTAQSGQGAVAVGAGAAGVNA